MKNYSKIGEFYIQEGEERLIKHILPDHYIGQSLSRIDAGYVLRFLQNELNELLQSFVNGGFSYKGYLLFPFINDVSGANVNRLRKLKEITVFLNKNGYDFSSSINAYKGNMGKSVNFAAILSSLYQNFSSIKNTKAKPLKKPNCPEFSIRDYRKSDLEYLKPLAELKGYANKNLRQYLAGFYLHGSLATKDYIKGWSDVDTLAVISKETMENPKNLLELRNKMYRMRYYFYKIDPLQHHGSIVISEYDLSNYCQAYFPVPIFKYAKSFFKGDKIRQFMARDYRIEALNKMFWFVNYFRKLYIEKGFSMGSYDTKNLLHSITLFPSMYLQAKGILVYKKFSFNIAKRDFSKDGWKIVEGISLIRNNWKGFPAMPQIKSFSKINPLFYYHANSRIIDLFMNTKKDNRINLKSIINGIFKLSEEAWIKTKAKC